MPQATKLGAHNFVAADLCCREVKGNIQPGNKILLYPQLPHEKGVANILGVHEQMDFLIHRNGHLGGDDIVSRLNIVFLVAAEEFLPTLLDPLPVKQAKPSHLTLVAENENQL